MALPWRPYSDALAAQVQAVNLEEIRARCSESVTEIVDSPREYFRAQQILRDRRDLLDATERGCFVLMEMMKAYERRIRTDCRNQEELDKRPWECAEYLAAASYLRAVWPVSVPPTGAKHDPG